MENKVKPKCTSIDHEALDAIIYCQQCRVYMCNKCEIFHSKLLKNHQTNKLDKNLKDIFTGFCKEENHLGKLEFFCETHNCLCCSDCLCKIKIKGKGNHLDCTVCILDDIKNEKKNELEKNIKLLKSLEKENEQLINELKLLFEKINQKKEQLKLEIQKIFTKLRNAINEREDKILIEVDKKFDNLYFKEDIIKDSEKLPNNIKESLEKGEKIDNDWNDENKLSSIINDCIKIENNISNINKINENIDKCNLAKDTEINFFPKEENEINKFLDNINQFGIINVNYMNIFKFKKCPSNLDKDRNYILSGEHQNILTKKGKDEEFTSVICENELKKDKEYIWKIRILKTKSYEINIGIAPIDFDFNSSQPFKNGWYFYCFDSTLYSGPPHNYSSKKTNLKQPKNEVKVVMNMLKRTLKFIVDNEENGYVCTDIPLDKLISPSVTLYNIDDSVEIIEC